MCGGTVLSIATSSPPASAPWWELPDYADGLFTAADHFTAEIIGNAVPPVERVEAAREFFRVHGDRALLDALDRAEGVYGILPPELAGVRARLA